MAVSKSTLQTARPDTLGRQIRWSSFDSGANNTYLDVNGKDFSKIIILTANLRSTDVGTTAGFFYIGASASASSGSCWERVYSGRTGASARLRLKHASATAKARIGASAASSCTIHVWGPFESARFKDSQGRIKLSKGKGSSDAGAVKIAAILIP